MSKSVPDREWLRHLPDLDLLRARTRGRRDIRIAVLDGPFDPAALGEPAAGSGPAAAHATLVASMIGGSALGSEGLAPGCTLLSFPIFADTDDTSEIVCSQEVLAEAIDGAVAAGAHIVNISASQVAGPLDVTTRLADAIAQARRHGLLIVAAAGNRGGAVDSIPACCAGVLAVGALGADGTPLATSNWGLHQRNGLLAPGIGLPGACIGGGTCRGTGTSFAAALVSGVAGLLMSLDAENGHPPHGERIRALLVASADPCRAEETDLCAPFLAGRLNVGRAMRALLGPEDPAPIMERSRMIQDRALAPAGIHPLDEIHGMVDHAAARRPGAAASPGLQPAHGDGGCGCGGSETTGCSCAETTGTRPQLVYAIGRLGVSFPSAARRDAIWRSIKGAAANAAPSRELDLKPIESESLVGLFEREPFQAQAVIWTLSRTEVPMYAILPAGAFAAETYEWLVREWADRDVELMSLPGTVVGKVTLQDGMMVDAVVPDLRGMFSWGTKRYVEALGEQIAPLVDGDTARTAQTIDRFLRKIYFRIRNRGLAPEERALNAAATNAFNVSEIIVQAGAEGLAFKDISVERSPLNRPGSEYYDVLLTFFKPDERLNVAPLVARFTIDVSDTVPVVIGEPVSWYEY